MKYYPISVELSGRLAFFGRDDHGINRASYPFPTRTALRGMIESIHFCPQVGVDVVRVDVCNPIKYTQVSYNYNGPLRKSDLIKNGSPRQVHERCLFNVRYKVYALLFRRQTDIPEPPKYKGINHAHSMQEQFMRGLRKGRCRRQPHFGRSQMLADSFGPLRDDTRPIDMDLYVPGMTFETFVDAPYGEFQPQHRDVEMKSGVVVFDEKESYYDW